MKLLRDTVSSAIYCLATLLIWLVVFSIYVIPVALVAWFIWRRIHPKPAIDHSYID